MPRVSWKSIFSSENIAKILSFLFFDILLQDDYGQAQGPTQGPTQGQGQGWGQGQDMVWS